jgi:hypothetical protein
MSQVPIHCSTFKGTTATIAATDEGSRLQVTLYTVSKLLSYAERALSLCCFGYGDKYYFSVVLMLFPSIRIHRLRKVVLSDQQKSDIQSNRERLGM